MSGKGCPHCGGKKGWYSSFYQKFESTGDWETGREFATQLLEFIKVRKTVTCMDCGKRVAKDALDETGTAC